MTARDEVVPPRLAFAGECAFETLPWDPPGGAWFGGRWVHADGPQLAVRHPESDRELGNVAACTPEQVSEAVAGLAAEQYETWPLYERREALARAAELLSDRAEISARLICTEGSKTINEGRREVARAIETLQVASRSSHALEGGTVPFQDSPRGTGRLGWYTWEPVGVVAAVTSFNDPLNLAVHKVAPALLSGNVVALKPAELTPFSSLHLAEVLVEAGVPAKRLAVLPGLGAATGASLVSHPDVDLVSFTGGTAGGRSVAVAAGARRTHMELGGNGPVIVCRDADLEAAAAAIVEGAFGFAGQNCISVQRVIARDVVVEELTARVCRLVDELQLGRRDRESIDMGCMITADAAHRVHAWTHEAAAQGARVLSGGGRNGAWVEPTVIAEPEVDSRVWSSEVFGPVLSIRAVESDDDAVTLANATQHRLQAGLFATDVNDAFTLSRRLRFGAVWINDSCDFRLDAMPCGGFGSSSIGREGVAHTVRAMTEPKIVAINGLGTRT